MTALDFPNAPTVGDKYPTPAVPGLPQYTWDGVKWTVTVVAAATVILADGTVPMAAALTLVGDPVNPTDAADKHYVDISPGFGGVRYDIVQSLTAPQQAQARANIASPVLRGYITNYTLSTAGASTTFTTQPGVAADSTAADYMTLTGAFNKTTASWAAGSGAGSLDTGAIAINTWYYVYIIKNPTTGVVDILTSANTTTPTLPSGFTLFRRIGAMKTNASSQWIRFYQFGDDFVWDTPIADVSAVNPGTAGASYPLPSIPNINVKANANFVVTNTVAPGVLYVDPITVTSTGVSAGYAAVCQVAGQAGNARLDVWIAAQSVHLQCNNASNNSAFVTVFGWRDPRGKDA